jgi:hypothetical protein
LPNPQQVTRPIASFTMTSLSQADFSGLWRLDLERSTLRGEPPSCVLVTIEHAEPELIQEMHVTRKDGTESSVIFHYDTSGGETANAQVRSRAHWVGAELLIESWMETQDRVLHFKDYWSLSADGAALTMTHRDDDLAGQTSILRRQQSVRQNHPSMGTGPA